MLCLCSDYVWGKNKTQLCLGKDHVFSLNGFGCIQAFIRYNDYNTSTNERKVVLRLMCQINTHLQFHTEKNENCERYLE